MINKTILCIALSSACIVTSTSAIAELPNNAILAFDAGVLGGYYGNVIVSGSYFAMDNDGSGTFEKSERVGIAVGRDGGITLAGEQMIYGTDGATGTPLEPGQIDAGWDFFGSHGWHTTTAAPVIVSDDLSGNVTLSMSGFTVHWNSGDIDMGQGANATVVCGVDCADGDTYTLDYTAVVPSGSFAGVNYQLHLEGTISLPLATNVNPVANDDAATVLRRISGSPYTAPVIDILTNDDDGNGLSDIDRATVAIDPNGTDTTTGAITVDPVTGNITYTPAIGSATTDVFTYEVTDKGGPTGVTLLSNVATVTITIQNAVPVAVDDSASIDTSLAPSVAIDVTFNDNDSDGTINKATVNILPANDVTNGSTSIDVATGVVTYTPNAGFVGVDTFQYTVEDDAGVSSNLATVVIAVSGGAGVLPTDAFLIIDSGTGVPGEGTYFTMEVNPGQLTFVGITGFDHIQLGVPQPASVAMPAIDDPWQFFGNLGVHQTLPVSPGASDAINVVTDDGNGNVTLDFSAWNVSWNNIVSIPLNNGADNGIATMTCAVDCAIGDTFSLIYRAIVPPGDPSGFGGVQYIFHMKGTISDTAPTVGGGSASAPYRVTDIEPIVAVDDSTSASPNTVAISPGSTATKAGNASGAGLTPAEIGVKDPSLNVNDGEQCIGGCIDFIATGVTTDFIDVVFKLNKPLPDGAVFRKLINGKWGNFSTSGGDQIGSANTDASGDCQGPEGKYKTGLRAGTRCIFLRIYDGGPNDADGVKNGTIVDPSGALLAGSSNVPPSSTSGCSISNTKVDLTERADWLIVAGFIAWLGFIGYRRNKTVN